MTLEDQLKIIKKMVRCGADIESLNIIRICLSNVKGGKLLLNLPEHTKALSLIISDIVGDPLQFISSGPTVFPDLDYNKFLQVLSKFKLENDIPIEIKYKIEENFHQQHIHKKLYENSVVNILIGNNLLMLKEVLNILQEDKNCYSYIVSDCIIGESKCFGQFLAHLAIHIINNKTNLNRFLLNNQIINEFKIHFKQPTDILMASIKAFEENVSNHFAADTSNKINLIFGGETTVTMPSTMEIDLEIKIKEDILYLNKMKDGKDHSSSDNSLNHDRKGGRNQEIALSFLYSIVKYCPYNFWKNIELLSIGSDGQDGPTDAAGVYIKLQNLPYKNRDYFLIICERFLNRHDSYTFFKHFNSGNCHLKPGLTGINLMDLQILSISLF